MGAEYENANSINPALYITALVHLCFFEEKKI